MLLRAAPAARVRRRPVVRGPVHRRLQRFPAQLRLPHRREAVQQLAVPTDDLEGRIGEGKVEGVKGVRSKL